MYFRKSPVKLIKKALSISEENNIPVLPCQLEAIHFAGGDPLKIVEAIVILKQNGIPAIFDAVSAVQLAGKDVLKVANDCLKEKKLDFDTYSPEKHDKIIGHTKDGVEVHCKCEILYQTNVTHSLGWNPSILQERLSSKLSTYINTSTCFRELKMDEFSHQAKLLVEAKSLLETVKSVSIDYFEKRDA